MCVSVYLDGQFVVYPIVVYDALVGNLEIQASSSLRVPETSSSLNVPGLLNKYMIHAYILLYLKLYISSVTPVGQHCSPEIGRAHV